MKISIIYFFSLLMLLNGNNFVDILASLSFNEFSEFIIESGYFRLLVNIKYSTNENVANIVCKGFVPSPHCEELIRTYMKVPTHRVSTTDIGDIKDYLLTEEFLPILHEYYNDEQINNIIDQINNILQKSY